jgi:hypothetical protein
VRVFRVCARWSAVKRPRRLSSEDNLTGALSGGHVAVDVRLVARQVARAGRAAGRELRTVVKVVDAAAVALDDVGLDLLDRAAGVGTREGVDEIAVRLELYARQVERKRN